MNPSYKNPTAAVVLSDEESLLLLDEDEEPLLDEDEDYARTGVFGTKFVRLSKGVFRTLMGRFLLCLLLGIILRLFNFRR